MDIAFVILFWIHLVALGLAGVAVFGAPVAGSKLRSATAEARPLLFSIIKNVSVMGRAAMALLLISGPLMLWLRYGWVPPNAWFWVKMLLVLALIGVVIYSGINGRRAEAGDMEAAKRAPQIGMAGMVTYVLLVLSAVLTFD